MGFDTELIGEIPCGIEINVVRNDYAESWIELHWNDSVIVCPAQQVPKLMIVLSIAHENATGEQWARPVYHCGGTELVRVQDG